VNIIIRLLLVLSLFLFAAGCASTRFGKDLEPVNAVSLTAGLKGKDKEAVIRTLGDPDFITSEKGSDYWGFRKHDGWNLNLYYASAGRTQASDLVLKLKDNKVMDAFIIGKGSSLGFISPPLSLQD
jgi:hypothetical protein